MEEVISLEYAESPYSPHGQKALFALSGAVQSILQALGAFQDCYVTFPAHEKELLQTIYSEIYTKVTSVSGQTQVLWGTLPSFFQNQAIKEWQHLGITTKFLPLSTNGQCDLALLEKHLNPRVALFMLPWICPLTGVVQPIDEIAEICKKKGVLFYVDASAALDERIFSVDALCCDLVSIKTKASLYLLLGKGALWHNLPEKLPLPCLAWLSHLQQLLENTVENIEQSIIDYSMKQEYFEKRLQELIPGSKIYGQDIERSCRIQCVYIPKVHQEMLLFYLQKMHILAEIGGGSLPKLADLLIARGIEAQTAYTSLSFHLELTLSTPDLEIATQAIAHTAEKLQKMSPL